MNNLDRALGDPERLEGVELRRGVESLCFEVPTPAALANHGFSDTGLPPHADFLSHCCCKTESMEGSASLEDLVLLLRADMLKRAELIEERCEGGF
mmetsp:Transcript_69269/g.192929  ORF Transcript_69269/g.192929 Transcript_69269/m.192929 type:complete len:96 (-) Transcript_69269:90-377(-)